MLLAARLPAILDFISYFISEETQKGGGSWALLCSQLFPSAQPAHILVPHRQLSVSQEHGKVPRNVREERSAPALSGKTVPVVCDGGGREGRCPQGAPRMLQLLCSHSWGTNLAMK